MSEQTYLHFLLASGNDNVKYKCLKSFLSNEFIWWAHQELLELCSFPEK